MLVVVVAEVVVVWVNVMLVGGWWVGYVTVGMPHPKPNLILYGMLWSKVVAL